MSLTDHLGELRSRVIRIALALTVGTIVGYVLYEGIFALLIAPYCDLPNTIRFGGGECSLVATKPLEAFSVRMKVSMLFGAFASGPIIFYQLWRFITPGLTTKERRYALPFVLMSQVMFAAGIAFAYLLIPKGLSILVGFGGNGIDALFSAQDYLSFLLTSMLAFGLVFELPLVLIFLAMVGAVSARQLSSWRPYALVINTLLAAVVTPTTDAVTLLFMAVPMAIFYEVAIVFAWVFDRARRRRSVDA